MAYWPHTLMSFLQKVSSKYECCMKCIQSNCKWRAFWIEWLLKGIVRFEWAAVVNGRWTGGKCERTKKKTHREIEECSKQWQKKTWKNRENVHLNVLLFCGRMSQRWVLQCMLCWSKCLQGTYDSISGCVRCAQFLSIPQNFVPHRSANALDSGCPSHLAYSRRKLVAVPHSFVRHKLFSDSFFASREWLQFLETKFLHKFLVRA